MDISIIPITTEEFLNYFVHHGFGVYHFILFCGFVFGLTNIKRLSPAGRGIWLIITISFVLEMTAGYLSIVIKSSAPSIHFVNLFHFLAYGYTFSKWKVNRRFAKGFFWAGVLLAAFALVNVILIQDIKDRPTITSLLLALALVLGSLVTFYNMVRRPSQTALLKQGLFWFNTSTLFFYASTFFSFALHDHYLEQWYATGVYMPLWATYLIRGMNYYLYISLFIAMWLDLKWPSDVRD